MAAGTGRPAGGGGGGGRPWPAGPSALGTSHCRRAGVATLPLAPPSPCFGQERLGLYSRGCGSTGCTESECSRSKMKRAGAAGAGSALFSTAHALALDGEQGGAVIGSMWHDLHGLNAQPGSTDRGTDLRPAAGFWRLQRSPKRAGKLDSITAEQQGACGAFLSANHPRRHTRAAGCGGASPPQLAPGRVRQERSSQPWSSHVLMPSPWDALGSWLPFRAHTWQPAQAGRADTSSRASQRTLQPAVDD